MEWVALLIAAGLGYLVTQGIDGHMEPIDGPPLPPYKPPVMSPAITCLETLDKLPTGSSDIDNLRNAAKKAYLVASTPADVMFLRTFAGELETSGVDGGPEAAACMRSRADEIEKGYTSGGSPLAPSPYASMMSGLPSGLTFPI